MKSEAKTVEEYLQDLSKERRKAIKKVREVILQNLPKGFEETMNWGMICYEVPLDTYPETYNKKPLMYAALASQKNHMAVYLSGIYIDDKHRQEFEKAYKATGKKYNAGKSCVRFKKLDDLPLDLIGKSIGSLEVEDFIAQHISARSKK